MAYLSSVVFSIALIHFIGRIPPQLINPAIFILLTSYTFFVFEDAVTNSLDLILYHG
jgi:hypothetical protein